MNTKKIPIIEDFKNNENIIYYRCPRCNEYIISTWDYEAHKIKRPDKCVYCNQMFNWNFKKEI